MDDFCLVDRYRTKDDDKCFGLCGRWFISYSVDGVSEFVSFLVLYFIYYQVCAVDR